MLESNSLFACLFFRWNQTFSSCFSQKARRHFLHIFPPLFLSFLLSDLYFFHQQYCIPHLQTLALSFPYIFVIHVCIVIIAEFFSIKKFLKVYLILV